MDFNHHTGEVIEGWDSVVQSIHTILTTRLNTRVFRREFGSEVPACVDTPMNDAGVLALYSAVSVALEKWEPRFEMTNVAREGAANGVITITLIGNYRPNAHKGDLSKIDDETRTIHALRDGQDKWSIAI